jgi:SpoVK/Ycf46/Vps4 family AAA+-type ATPase
METMKGPEKIRRALLGGHPVIYVQSWEEGRVERVVGHYAKSFYQKPASFGVWSIVDGLKEDGKPVPDTREPHKALASIIAGSGPGFYLMKDLPGAMNGDGHGRPELTRLLRDAYRALKDKGRFLFLVSPRLYIPEDAKKEVFYVEYELPDEVEITKIMDAVLKGRIDEGGLPESDNKRLALALKGLTADEIGHLLHKVFATRRVFDESAFQEVLAEKEQMSKKEGVLEFVPPKFTIDDLGGYDNLKEWLKKRKALFTREALEAGVPIPKGILLMGISGCGKSLGVKVISTLWNLPLFRLDMNNVFSGAAGNAEMTFQKALRSVEAAAPAVLWIDEIEMGVGSTGQGDSSMSRIFAGFLTWMQEKDPFVFVAATANRIHLLPAEVIRKGRFDQVFFVDLPNEEERKQIFGIHLTRNRQDAGKFDLVFLAKATRGWNGAEIEQAVVSAVVDAYSEKRTLTEQDLYKMISATVPLSVTMEDQIKAIKSWAHDRAISASK